MGCKIANHIKSLLWKIDLFNSAQLLRYKTETGYSTLTGGFISLLIIIVFGALLVLDSVSVLTMGTVNAQDFTYYLDDPTFTTFTFDETSNFIIGVGITGLNLSDSRRYFDITLSTQVFYYGNFSHEYEQNLQMCEYEQWAHIADVGGSSFIKSNMTNFLCPTSDVTVELQGKFTSPVFKLLRLKIGKCKNETDPSRPCWDEAKISSRSTYNMNYFFMNAFVNSGTLEPIGYYLEDRDYFGITLDSTIVSNLYITQNFISTDTSLFPWTRIENQTVLTVKELAEVKTSMNFKDQYISVYLRKSPYYILSQRSFPKLQDLFSAIGGLFGFAISFFLFMQFYTQAAFEIEMADRLFYYKADEPLNSSGFNFLYYLAYCVYQKLRIIGIDIPWNRMKKYYEGRREVEEQLDLSLLMNKITFLEKCMNVIFEEHQFRAIYLQQKPNVKEAEQLRRNHGLNKIIHRNAKKINDRIQDKVKSHHEKLLKEAKSSDKHLQIKDTLDVADGDGNKNGDVVGKANGERPYDLMQIVTDFIMQDTEKEDGKIKPIEKVESQQQEPSNSPSLLSENIQLEDFTDESPEQLQFINTALQDIKRLQAQSSRDKLSSRIYNQLNNDITKEQLMILKCLETIMANKPPSEEELMEMERNGSAKENMLESLKTIRASNKRSLFKNLMKITMPVEDVKERKEEQDGGLEIVLDVLGSGQRLPDVDKRDIM